MKATMAPRTRRAVLASPDLATSTVSRPRQRPLGVTILSILSLVSGFILVVSAILVLLLGVVFTESAARREAIERFVAGEDPNETSTTPIVFSLVAALFALFFLVFAIPSILIAWGFWGGRGWSWTLFIVLTLISVPINVLGPLLSLLTGQTIGQLLFQVGSAAFSLAFGAFCLWYLYQPGVRAYFGKSHMRAPWQGGATAA